MGRCTRKSFLDIINNDNIVLLTSILCAGMDLGDDY